MTKPKFLTGNAIETNDAECKADAAATPVQTKVQTTSFPVGDGDDLSGTSEAADIADTADPAGAHDSTPKPEPAHSKPGGRWKRAVVYGVLPGLALLLALAAGYLNLQDTAVRDSQAARTQSVQAATDSTIALLSYRPDTVDKDLAAARDRMTGSFRDSYAALIHDVVIPGVKQKQISAAASVPAAAAVATSEKHSVVIVFVNQTVTVGGDAPSNTASTVRVTLEKINGRWLISGFDPI